MTRPARPADDAADRDEQAAQRRQQDPGLELGGEGPEGRTVDHEVLFSGVGCPDTVDGTTGRWLADDATPDMLMASNRQR